MADIKNPYDILGVTKTASADEIKSAYRGLAKKYHPDLYATAPESERKAAEEKFKDIQHAYEILSDPQKKAAFDQYGNENGPTMGGAGFNPFGEGGGFEDFFSNIFNGFTGGGNARGASSRRERNGDDIECDVLIGFKEACFGIKDKEVIYQRMEKCASCGGTGSRSRNGIKTCPKCGGTGRITINQRTPFGVMQTRVTCDQCRGEGKIIVDRCPDCSGRGVVRRQHAIKINIPAGIDNGNTMTVRGEGSAAVGGENGDLYLNIKVAPSALFVRENTNISYELPITFMQAVLGARLTVPTLDGSTVIDIPEGTQNGTVIRVKGKGVKNLRKDTYGDLYIHILVEIPKSLSGRQKAALSEAAAAMDKAKYDKIDRFNKIIKDI
jgi:molecular chaperone DnaJ